MAEKEEAVEVEVEEEVVTPRLVECPALHNLGGAPLAYAGIKRVGHPSPLVPCLAAASRRLQRQR